ncbi:fumarylacetoacetate hydrolase family protein [Singulisphaera sp. PoT]|uniref:fumarylacetoacetate hydrolase family protein n=1 Tax=Singulisphaera sp. PoT TaxID=3411797 RepID=UPI003BF61408
MRWVTVQTERGPQACGVLNDEYIEVASADPAAPSNLRELLGQGEEVLRRVWAALPQGKVRHDPAVATLLSPIYDPQKIVCLGLNYRDHAIESGMEIPPEPVLFSKYPSTLVGHGAEIVLPAVSTQVDYEAELVIVVGKKGRFVAKENAYEYVAGYAVGHDVSARDWQLNKPGKQWMAGKTFDTFAPIGPMLVSSDEVPDPHALGIRLRLNGETMQDSSTSQLIFRVDEIIAYLSQIFTLEPGDLIFTGTPPGVGMARKPQVWLKPGDVAEVEIDGLGTLRNPVVGPKA